MTEQEKIKLLEETLEMDNGSLSSEMILDELDEYDSLAKLSLIVMAEDNFGVKLQAKDIKRFVTVQDILDIMK